MEAQVTIGKLVARFETIKRVGEPLGAVAPASGDFCITPSRSDSLNQPRERQTFGYLLTNEHSGSGGPNASSPLICARIL
jgi:hypothetical protein